MITMPQRPMTISGYVGVNASQMKVVGEGM